MSCAKGSHLQQRLELVKLFFRVVDEVGVLSMHLALLVVFIVGALHTVLDIDQEESEDAQAADSKVRGFEKPTTFYLTPRLGSGT